MTAIEQVLIEKIRQLPRHVFAGTQGSVSPTRPARPARPALSQVWDNDEDAVYDRL